MPGSLRRPPPKPPTEDPVHNEVNAILDSPRSTALVREMPTVALHRLVTALGRTEAHELLALATPEQVRELLDLDVWQGDRVLVTEALDWLHAITALPAEVQDRDLAALDPELVGTVLLSRAKIHLVVDEDFADWEPEDPESVAYRTPDGWFVVEIAADDQLQAEQVIGLLEALYRRDPDQARRLLQNLQVELLSELEEMSYRWRSGRLQDLGFADPAEALVIYAWLDPASVRPGEGTADRPPRADPEAPPRSELVPLFPQESSFWNRAQAQIEDDAERERLAWALLALSNRTLTADGVRPADLEGLKRSMEGLHWRLSVGLEHLSRSDLAQTGAVLASVALLRIARVGHSLALELRRQLQPALRSGRLGSAPGRLDRLGPPLLQEIKALAAERPAYFDESTERARPFRSLADIEQGRGWIARSLAAAELISGLGITGPYPPGLTFGDLFRTDLANRLLARQGPIDRSALAELLRRFVKTGELAPAAGRALSQVPEAIRPEAQAWIEEWLTELQDSLGSLDPDDLDLRFVGGLWLTLPEESLKN